MKHKWEILGSIYPIPTFLQRGEKITNVGLDVEERVNLFK